MTSSDKHASLLHNGFHSAFKKGGPNPKGAHPLLQVYTLTEGSMDRLKFAYHNKDTSLLHKGL